MKKTDTIKIIISILVIITLAAFIVNINKVISPKKQKIIKEPLTPISSEAVKDYGKCFNDSGESPNTIVFVHSNYCPHCRNMIPIIKDLENDGYKFYWAESSNTQASSIVSNCFSNLLSGYVPQFICPKTGQQQTGEMTKSQLKEFSNNCI